MKLHHVRVQRMGENMGHDLVIQTNVENFKSSQDVIRVQSIKIFLSNQCCVRKFHWNRSQSQEPLDRGLPPDPGWSNSKPEVVGKIWRLAHDVAELLLVDGPRPIEVSLGQNLISENLSRRSVVSKSNMSSCSEHILLTW